MGKYGTHSTLLSITARLGVHLNVNTRSIKRKKTLKTKACLQSNRTLQSIRERTTTYSFSRLLLREPVIPNNNILRLGGETKEAVTDSGTGDVVNDGVPRVRVMDGVASRVAAHAGVVHMAAIVEADHFRGRNGARKLNEAEGTATLLVLVQTHLVDLTTLTENVAQLGLRGTGWDPGNVDRAGHDILVQLGVVATGARGRQLRLLT